MTAPDDHLSDLLKRCFQRPAAEWPQAIETLCSLYPEHAGSLRLQLAASRSSADALPDSPSFEMFGMSVAPEDEIEENAALPEPTDEFRFLRPLGRGGMGVVYEAEDLTSGRRVAVKVVSEQLSFSDSASERFDREARTAARISHPNCVFVYGAHRINGRPAISMELMSGETLDDVLKREGPLPIEKAVGLAAEVLKGLEAAHEAGIIHRDIKPANLFLTDEGRVKVGDFGLSRPADVDLRLTTTGTFLGSPLYASPEQVRGKSVDERTDVYAVGATLYAIVTGKVPHQATSIGDLFAQIATELPKSPRSLRPDLPRGLEKVILRALDKNPDRRYPTCAAFRAAIAPYGEGALSPGGLGLRVGAYWIDAFVVTILSRIADLLIGRFILHYRDQLATAAITLSVGLLYFGIQEGLYGRTLGKLFLGLRVSGPSGGPPGIGRATLRALIFNGDIVFRGLVAGSLRPATLLVTLLPFVSVRARNGFRGLHEFASGTRVLQTKSGITKLRRARLLDPPRVTADHPAAIGRFAITARLLDTKEGVVYVARDPRLDRLVWVHALHDAANALPVPARSGRFPTTLRWLESGSERGMAWDVFEAPGGAALSEYAATSFAMDWDTARNCLLSLATLLEETPATLTSEQLWIDRNGNLRVLDFTSEAGAPSQSGLALIAEAVRALLDISPGRVRELDLSESGQETLERLLHAPERFEGISAARRAIDTLEAIQRPVPRTSRLAQVVASGTYVLFVTFLAVAMNLESGRVSGVSEAFLTQMRALPMPVVLAGAFALLICVPSLIAATVLRGGFLFWVFRIGVLDDEGRRATRRRCLLRAAITLSPLMIALLLALAFGERDWTAIILIIGASIVGLAAIAAVIWPRRALSDVLAGTHLAMK